MKTNNNVKFKDRCEWNPKFNIPACDPPLEGDCENSAVLSVGKNGEWHLCKICASLPIFKRYKIRNELLTR